MWLLGLAFGLFGSIGEELASCTQFRSSFLPFSIS